MSDQAIRSGAAKLRDAGVPAVDLSTLLAGQTIVFATVSGAHLYGFPSRDSDVDLRGAHLLPVADLLGLKEREETRTRMGDHDGVETDLVTHDLRKFARLMLRRNGYVLEQLLSPLVVHTTDVHAELTALAPGLLTRNHAHHYRGFAVTQWRLFGKQGAQGELKPLLYTLRVLLTGIHLMRSGEVVAHLPTLAGLAEAPAYVAELIAAKAEAEHGPVRDLVDAARLQEDVERLHTVLDDAQAASRLPEQLSHEAYDALHDLVVRARTSA
ncbi:DNA polymerase beta superfamily protein [Streptomyces roseifaciens]|uniref:nucleotidyltransferase domain-containing protein n=1 Tax=Streptomyces roseifaciens TaxID=1488406 RepID=UPI0007180C99|nr:nucleotidyltransferase domain-containing protein [Streptomyces roseifaciens]